MIEAVGKIEEKTGEKTDGCEEKERLLEVAAVGPGEKAHGFLELTDGQPGVPAAVICGVRPGKTVLITAGIHAGEYVGIQTAVELAGEISPEEVSGRIILVKAVCREAFERREGSIGRRDGKNLNREFPGRADGTQTQRLARAVVERLHSEADYYIDLHSGDDYEQLTPYIYYAGKAAPEVVEISRRMACQADVPYMVRSDVASGGSYNYAASMGIPSVLVERGQMGAWSAEEVQSMKKDVRSILDVLGVCRARNISRSYYPLDVTQVCYQAASCFGLWYPAKKPGDLIRRGEVLGVTKDYEGNILETSVAETGGVILYQTGSLQVAENGPMIAYGRIDYSSDTRKEAIADYWTRRSAGFLEQRRQELHSPLAGRFAELLRSRLRPDAPAETGGERPLKILDVGCGTGFFSILLARDGHEVTGVDLTPDMIRYAETLAEEELDHDERGRCRFRVMDAEHLEFPDGTFDAVVSRNLTWTLPDVERAYREWSRVLRAGGVLINIDANYGNSDFTDTAGLPQEHAHHQIGREMMEECERLKRQLPISSCARPGWDLQKLGGLGMESFLVELGISRTLYTEEDAFYNPTPLFLIRAKKESGVC